MSSELVEAVARRFRMLGEPARLRLLQLLEGGERTVNDLAAAAGGTQANISRHLTALHGAGLVGRRREGGCVYYSISDPVVWELCELVCRSTREQLQAQLGALGEGSGRGRRRAKE